MMLQAGALTADITPSKPMFLAGYPHIERISEGVHDPLTASAIYLENDGSAALLISLDLLLVGIKTARKLRREISRQLTLPEAHILISCTHTHSSPLTGDILAFKHDPVVPEVDPEYVACVVDAVINAAVNAKNAARPAKLAWTTAAIDGVGCNRHSPSAPRDPEAGILAIAEQESGRMMAMALIYAMHPTVLHEDSKLISADFPAFTRRTLTEKFGSDLVVAYHTASAGNQSPRYHVKAQSFAEAERLGRRLGDFVIAAVDHLKPEDFDPNPSLAGSLRTINPIPRKFLTLAEAEAALGQARETFERLKREEAGHGPVRTAECAVFGAEESLFLARCRDDGRLDEYLREYTPCDIQVLKIGDACLIGLPGELFVEYTLEIKRDAPGKTFVISLVNGDLQGYIVTPEAAATGGYEAANALFAPETGAKMVSTALEMLSSTAFQ